MPGYRWKRDNDGKLHLEDDVLLAYTRGQLAADTVLIVQQHCANCMRCTEKCAEYTRTGMTLQRNLMYTMPVYPSVVNLLGNALDNPAAASVALRQRRKNKRRVRKVSGSRRLRLFPGTGVFPLTVSVSLVLLMVLLVYMLTTHIGILALRGLNGPVSPSIVSQPTPTPTATPTQAPTPKPTKIGSATAPTAAVTVTPTGVPSPTVTPTATPPVTSKPVIWICSSNADLAQSRLLICGKNFKAGDRVIVVEYFSGSGRRGVMPTTADAQGNINVVWTIQNCRSIPNLVFAFDMTHSFMVPPIPVNVSLGGCPPPNINPGGGGPGGSGTGGRGHD